MKIVILKGVAGIFIIGGILALIMVMLPEKKSLRKEFLELYLFEFALVGLIIIPAFLGFYPFLLLILFMGLRTAHEIKTSLIARASAAQKIVFQLSPVFLCLGAAFGGELWLFRAMILILACFVMVSLQDKNTAANIVREKAFFFHY